MLDEAGDRFRTERGKRDAGWPPRLIQSFLVLQAGGAPEGWAAGRQHTFFGVSSRRALARFYWAEGTEAWCGCSLLEDVLPCPQGLQLEPLQCSGPRALQ